jgi:hypothetical protein
MYLDFDESRDQATETVMVHVDVVAPPSPLACLQERACVCHDSTWHPSRVRWQRAGHGGCNVQYSTHLGKTGSLLLVVRLSVCVDAEVLQPGTLHWGLCDL